MAAITICSDFGAPQNKVWHCFHCFPIYFPWSDGTDAMIFFFWMLSFKPTFSLSTFTFIKRLTFCHKGGVICISEVDISPGSLDSSLCFFQPSFSHDILTSKKDVLFIIGCLNAKVESQETPGVTGKFGLGIQNEVGQRLIEFCQENALVIANTLLQQHKERLYTWTSQEGQYCN